VQRSASLRRRLAHLRGAGLSAQASHTILNVYSQGCVTHLQRASYDTGDWLGKLDDVHYGMLEDVLGDSLDSSRREQASLRLKDGGAGLNSAAKRAPSAYCGSWALTLASVAAVVGAQSFEGFCSQCPGVCAELERADHDLRTAGGNKGKPLDWVSCFANAQQKRQGAWSRDATTQARDALLASLPEDERVVVREHGGTGAGSYLLPPNEDTPPVPDAHFRLVTRRRLRLHVCPPGARCHNRRRDGRVCGAPLDPDGRHALTCEVGKARTHRHNRLRDWSAATHSACTGALAGTEQHVPQWDRVNPSSGLLEQAVLDVATRDPRDGRVLYIDTGVTCALSINWDRLQARANRDGAAATQYANAKHVRYPADQVPGATLAAFILETGGRPAQAVVSLMRYWGSQSSAPEQGASLLWQQLSTALQLGNAESILSALGPQ
jgi:hypothetical protein